MNIYEKNTMDLIENALNGNGGIVVNNLFIQVPINFVLNPAYTSQQKMLYMTLWCYGIKSKYAFPSQSKIAEVSGMSASTQRRIFKQLEELGGIYVIHRFKKNNKKEKLTNLYYLADINTDGSFSTSITEILRIRFPDKKAYL